MGPIWAEVTPAMWMNYSCSIVTGIHNAPGARNSNGSTVQRVAVGPKWVLGSMSHPPLCADNPTGSHIPFELGLACNIERSCSCSQKQKDRRNSSCSFPMSLPFISYTQNDDIKRKGKEGIVSCFSHHAFLTHSSVTQNRVLLSGVCAQQWYKNNWVHFCAAFHSSSKKKDRCAGTLK